MKKSELEAIMDAVGAEVRKYVQQEIAIVKKETEIRVTFAQECASSAMVIAERTRDVIATQPKPAANDEQMEQAAALADYVAKGLKWAA